MDLPFFADVYGTVYGFIGRYSYVAVFMLGGLLLSGLWWGAGKSYRRQEAAIARADATDRQIGALAQDLTNLKAAQPVVVNMPKPDRVLPHPVIAVSDAVMVQDNATRRIEARIEFKNQSDYETDATLSVEMFINKIPVPGLDAPKTYDMSPGKGTVPGLRLGTFLTLSEDAYAKWLAGETKVTVVARAVYPDGGKSTTYEMRCEATPNLAQLAIKSARRFPTP